MILTVLSIYLIIGFALTIFGMVKSGTCFSREPVVFVLILIMATILWPIMVVVGVRYRMK